MGNLFFLSLSLSKHTITRRYTREMMLESQVELVGILDGIYEDSGNQFQARCSYTVDGNPSSLLSSLVYTYRAQRHYLGCKV